MTKKERKYRDYLGKIMKKYIPILGLDRYHAELGDGAGEEAYFDLVFNYPYLDILVRYSPESMKRWEKGEDMTRYIVHELCHTITDPLYAKAKDRHAGEKEIETVREELTDHIAKIILK